MALSGKRLAVAMPDTVLEERDSTREKTVKLGLIARACSIYGVDLVEVYRDEEGGEPKLIKLVLDYLETPQYLRKRLYPLDDALKFAGLLPPLRTPSHKAKVPMEQVKVGEVREGVANADGTVDIGLDRSPLLKGKVQTNARVTVRLVSREPLLAERIGRSEVGEYWGYQVELTTIDRVLADDRFELKIATSRLGDPLSAQLSSLRDAVRRSDSVKLLFGSPSRGLFDIVGKDLPKKADFVLNLFVDQHVKTVRTEEALFAGLGLLNAMVA